jgi:hypothetical protein
MKARALWFIVVGLVVAAVLLALLRPPTATGPSEPVISQSPTGPAVPISSEPPGEATAAVPAPVAASFDFVVKDGQRVAGPVSMQAREGVDVSIKVTSDRADELHVHGYELHTPVKPNEPAALYFKATHSGRFEVELHQAHLQLGTLEVQPK